MEKLVTADNNKVPPTFVSQTWPFYVEFLMTTNLFCNESNEWWHTSFPLCSFFFCLDNLPRVLLSPCILWSRFQYSRLCRPEEGRHSTVEVSNVTKCGDQWLLYNYSLRARRVNVRFVRVIGRRNAFLRTRCVWSCVLGRGSEYDKPLEC